MSIVRPTDERIAKAEGEFEERVVKIGEAPEAVVLQMLDGSILDRLASRHQISGDQYAAGSRFYNDWYAAGFASSGVVDPSKDVVDGGNSEPSQVRQMDAASRWTRAVQYLGKIHSHALINIILLEESLAEYGTKYHQQNNPKLAALSAVVSLRNALTQLDQHYYGQRTERSRHAHSPDYRPTDINPTKE